MDCVTLQTRTCFLLIPPPIIMKNLFSGLLSLIPFLLFSQSESSLPDPLEATPSHFDMIMNMTDVSQEEISIVLKMFNQYHLIDKDTAQLIAKKMVDLSHDYPNDFTKLSALNMYGYSLFYTNKYDESILYYEQTKTLAILLENDRLQGTALFYLGKIKQRQDEPNSAIDYYLSSIISFEKQKDTTQLFSIYYDIAGLYFGLSLLDKTEEYIAKAVAIAETKDSDKMKMVIYGARSSILSRTAKNYYEKAKKDTLNKELHLDSYRTYISRSLENSELKLKLAEKNKDKLAITSVLIGMVGTNNNLKDYDQAVKVGKRAEKLLKERGDNKFQSRLDKLLAIAYFEKGDPKQALIHAKKSMEFAQQSGDEKSIRSSHDYLYRVYGDLDRYDKALDHLEAYDRSLAKTNDMEKIQLMADAEAKFESVKKEKQILEQRNDILELESSNAQITNERNGIIGSSLLIFILGFFGYNFFKIKKDRNDKMAFAEALIFAQEDERKRIARDLHDGVGQSLLLIKKGMAATHEVTVENQQMISDTLEEVRTISRDLHPFQLEKFGLTASINDVIEKVERSTDLFITKEIVDVDQVFLKKNQIHIFRVIQEALSNIVKHAEATAAKVSIVEKGNELIMKIMDNGKGYDHELAIVTSKSLGLRTMHERISSIGGQLIMEQNVPSGTILTFTIPKNN